MNSSVAIAHQPKDDDGHLKEAKEIFEAFTEADRDNRAAMEEDILFVDEDKAQWPDEVRQKREEQNLPCLTTNRLKPIVRQVVNEARQNKPGIKVSAVDSNADPDTAELLSGRIRNIEHASNAEVAYDTGVECAVKGGRGFWRIDIDYAHDSAFEFDLFINRIANPSSVVPDAYSTAADSSDWNDCFVTELVSNTEYRRRFKDNNPVDWDTGEWASLKNTGWMQDRMALIAEWWHREEVEKQVYRLSNGFTVEHDVLLNDPDMRRIMFLLNQGRLQVTGERLVNSHKVTQRIMSGAEILETVSWPGKYIPIIPVYGDEYWSKGRRHTRGLIHHAKDPQRMLNYWSSQSTALVALAPRNPWLLAEGSADADPDKWGSANAENHAFIEYGAAENGQYVPPIRQPIDSGVAAGALQQGAQSSQDIHHTTGIYNNSLGDSGNEVSGVAINRRQTQGDKSTFHFVDNQNRAIAHTGKVLVDLIPHVDTKDRLVRILGKDGKTEDVQLGKPMLRKDPQTGQPRMAPKQMPNGQVIMAPDERAHDFSVGRYDVSIDAGPSYQTQREAAAEGLTEFVRSAPQIGPFVFDIIAENQDWPGADEISKRLKAMLPPQLKGQGDPQVMQMQGQLKQAGQMMQMMQGRVAQLEQQLRDKTIEQQVKMRGVDIDAYEAVTDRIEAATKAGQQAHNQALPQAQQNMRAVEQYRQPVIPPSGAMYRNR